MDLAPILPTPPVKPESPLILTLRFLTARWLTIGGIVAALPLLLTGHVQAGIGAIVTALLAFASPVAPAQQAAVNALRLPVSFQIGDDQPTHLYP